MFRSLLSNHTNSIARVLALGGILLIVGVMVSFSRETVTSLVDRLTQPQTLFASHDSYQKIYLSSKENGHNQGGVIALASTDEPAVFVDSYQNLGSFKVTLYESNEDALLNYLLHDSQSNQTQKVDTSNLTVITSTTIEQDSDKMDGTKVPLPLKETGIWLVHIKSTGSAEAYAFVIRSNIGVVTHEGDNQLIFWAQDFRTKRRVSDGTITLYDLQDSRTEVGSGSFDSEGIAQTTLTSKADIALVRRGDDRALVPLNLQYLNYGFSYKQFDEKERLIRHFVFTDRPLYEPGNSINFKAILRADDDARYSIPSGEAIVRIYDEYYYYSEESPFRPIFEKRYPISSDGTVAGTYQLPENAKVGSYTLTVEVPSYIAADDEWYSRDNRTSTTNFNVEFFQKPEFSVEVSVADTQLVAGEDAAVTIRGAYFSGQPLIGQKVRYSVKARPWYDHYYLSQYKNSLKSLEDAYRYGGYYSGSDVAGGVIALDEKGEAQIQVPTKSRAHGGKTHLYTVQAFIDDSGQAPAASQKNILVYAGDFGIFRTDRNYSVQLGKQLKVPVTLAAHKGASVADIPLTALVKRTQWIQKEKSKDSWYPKYEMVSETVPKMEVSTDSNGEAIFSLTPEKSGSYEFTVKAVDARGNEISQTFYAYVSGDDEPFYSENGYGVLSLALDKQNYQPTDTLKLSVFSEVPDRDVFVALQRGRVDRYQVVKLNGKSANIDIPLKNSDVPNMFISASSFAHHSYESKSVPVPVSPEDKKIVVEIASDDTSYGPGETVKLDITTTDLQGRPVSADVAVWSVDKAIFELAESNLEDIFERFWYERSDSTSTAHSLQGILVNQAEGGGGCFAGGTQVMMADGTMKSIQDIQVGEYVLTRTENNSTLVSARVAGTHKAQENGYLIVNGHLKVTANHILWVNGAWREAGSIQMGDTLVDAAGNTVSVDSLEWQRGKFEVYNLEIEKHHTYFAGGVWVHNDKGESRSVFKDTAYWNPSVRTNSSGKASVSFVVPDNLTTWTIAAVAASPDTQVGQGTSEIVVTKDIIIRPIVPNILRQGDEIIFSALAQNFTQTDQEFDVSLSFDAGEIEQATHSGVLIKAEDMQQLHWKVRVTDVTKTGKLVFSMKSTNDQQLQDTIELSIPVRAFGYHEQKGYVADGAHEFDLQMSADADLNESQVTLSLAPSLVGTLPNAMSYLVDYPYGCVEQTTSRFVPVVIAKSNPQLFKDVLADKDLDAMLEAGLTRLRGLQNTDGGWGWWSTGVSDPFISAYVLEYLIEAEKVGAEIDPEMMSQVSDYFTNLNVNQTENRNAKENNKTVRVVKNYGLSLLGKNKEVTKVDNISDLSSDLLAMHVMTQYRVGNRDPEANGLNVLISQAQKSGENAFWEAGSAAHFGSRDATTALAVRAILFAGGDRDSATAGVRYLVRSKKREYWSNTYATSQVIRTVTEFSKTDSELTPAYSYAVLLDGEKIAEGTVDSSTKTIENITVPVDQIQQQGSKLSITKSGDGQLYSTLMINEFRTDPETKSLDNGLKVTREYINEAGEEYTLGVGDSVIVSITVSGLSNDEPYGLIHDELPAGMIAINENFKNEKMLSANSLNKYGFAHKEILESGVNLSLHNFDARKRTYTYRARVVSEGVFRVPPATVSLMYRPEVYGHSAAQTVILSRESEVLPIKRLELVLKDLARTNSPFRMIVRGIIAIIVLIGVGIFVVKKLGIDWEAVHHNLQKYFQQVRQYVNELVSRLKKKSQSSDTDRKEK